jgi:hypothetical protein
VYTKDAIRFSLNHGEDVVQDTLAKACYAPAEMESPPLRPAHNTAMDFLRRYEHRNVDAAADMEVVAAMVESPEPEEHGPDGKRVEAAFAALPPVQRSALALKDVLSLSLEETRLDVVSRYQRLGRSAARYFTRYTESARLEDLRAEAGWVDGVPTIAMFRPASSSRPACFMIAGEAIFTGCSSSHGSAGYPQNKKERGEL